MEMMDTSSLPTTRPRGNSQFQVMQQPEISDEEHESDDDADPDSVNEEPHPPRRQSASRTTTDHKQEQMAQRQHQHHAAAPRETTKRTQSQTGVSLLSTPTRGSIIAEAPSPTQIAHTHSPRRGKNDVQPPPPTSLSPTNHAPTVEVRVLNNQISTLHRRSSQPHSSYPPAPFTLKLAIVGPCQSGKTKITNILANQERIHTRYEPTEGVRILEFDIHTHARSRDASKQIPLRIACEVWDLSGDHRYESCWPAVIQHVHGVIVCFDPKSKAQADEVKVWCEWMALHGQLKTDQLTIFCHGNLTQPHKALSIKAGDRLLSVPIVNVNSDITLPAGSHTSEDHHQLPVVAEFANFVGGVAGFHPSFGSLS